MYVTAEMIVLQRCSSFCFFALCGLVNAKIINKLNPMLKVRLGQTAKLYQVVAKLALVHINLRMISDIWFRMQ